MINNLINHYFYDIKKQWNCAGVFLVALKSYTIKTATIDKELAETNAYFARKTADEYGAITVDDDYGAVINQMNDDNYLASNLKRQEINDTKTATDKTNRRQARRDNNNDYTNYFEALLALQTTYEIAIATADAEYYDTVTTAEVTAIAAIDSAENDYNHTVGLLESQFEDTMAVIDNGNDIETRHFNAAATSASNNVQQNGNNGNGTNQNSSGSSILNQIKGQIRKLWGWIVSTDGSITATERFNTIMPNNNLGNVPINPDSLVTKMRLQQQINASEQIASYTNNVADGIEVAVFVAGMFLPGPDDIFWGYVSSKYGIKLVTEAGSRLLYRNGEKLSGEALKSAEEILIRMKIVKHVRDGGIHFPRKSIEQLDNLVQTTIKNAKTNGKVYQHPTITNRTLYHDKSTNIIVIYDGKGGGTMFKPDDIKVEIKKFLNN
jgi:hypothetical protein